MKAARKQQIAWWAAKVREQAVEYAGVADSNVADKLNAIAELASEIHTELTGNLPAEASHGILHDSQ